MYKIYMSSLKSQASPVKLPQWILLCLLTTRRVILKAWISSSTPSNVTIKKKLKSLLYIEKLDTIIQNVGPTKRFFRSWKSFMEHSLLSSEIHLLMKSFQYMELYIKANLTNFPSRLKLPEDNVPVLPLPSPPS